MPAVLRFQKYVSHRLLAELYGVTRANVSYIARRTTWHHVPELAYVGPSVTPAAL